MGICASCIARRLRARGRSDLWGTAFRDASFRNGGEPIGKHASGKIKSDEGNLEDFVGLAAARRHDLNRIANLFTDKRARNRGFD